MASVFLDGDFMRSQQEAEGMEKLLVRTFSADCRNRAFFGVCGVFVLHENKR